MKIAFYKSQHGGVVDTVINSLSGRGGYSHVELVFSDGRFFSSSGEDGGVRFRGVVPDASHWTMFELPVTAVEEAVLRAWCATEIGKKYDWTGVIGFVFPTHCGQGRWFCSEICLTALQQIGLFPGIEAWHVMPNDFFFICEAAKLEHVN
jgi:hypothetical protein